MHGRLERLPGSTKPASSEKRLFSHSAFEPSRIRSSSSVIEHDHRRVGAREDLAAVGRAAPASSRRPPPRSRRRSAGNDRGTSCQFSMARASVNDAGIAVGRAVASPRRPTQRDSSGSRAAASSSPSCAAARGRAHGLGGRRRRGRARGRGARCFRDPGGRQQEQARVVLAGSPISALPRQSGRTRVAGIRPEAREQLGVGARRAWSRSTACRDSGNRAVNANDMGDLSGLWHLPKLSAGVANGAPAASRPNLEGMARSPLTLAALATSAVAGTRRRAGPRAQPARPWTVRLGAAHRPRRPQADHSRSPLRRRLKPSSPPTSWRCAP